MSRIETLINENSVDPYMKLQMVGDISNSTSKSEYFPNIYTHKRQAKIDSAEQNALWNALQQSNRDMVIVYGNKVGTFKRSTNGPLDIKNYKTMFKKEILEKIRLDAGYQALKIRPYKPLGTPRGIVEVCCLHVLEWSDLVKEKIFKSKVFPYSKEAGLKNMLNSNAESKRQEFTSWRFLSTNMKYKRKLPQRRMKRIKLPPRSRSVPPDLGRPEPQVQNEHPRAISRISFFDKTEEVARREKINIIRGVSPFFPENRTFLTEIPGIDIPIETYEKNKKKIQNSTFSSPSEEPKDLESLIKKYFNDEDEVEELESTRIRNPKARKLLSRAQKVESKMRAAVRFPLEEIYESERRLEKAKRGEIFVKEFKKPKSWDEIFPIVKLKKPNKIKRAVTKLTAQGRIPSKDFSHVVKAVTLKHKIEKDMDTMSKFLTSSMTEEEIKEIKATVNDNNDSEDNTEAIYSELDALISGIHKRTFKRFENVNILGDLDRKAEEVLADKTDVKDAEITKIDLENREQQENTDLNDDEAEKRRIINYARAPTDIFKKKFQKHQIELQCKLLADLDNRVVNRKIIYQSADHLSKVALHAVQTAKNWRISRNERSRKFHDIWNKAREELENRKTLLHMAELFYKRLLVYMEYIGSPTRQIQLDFVNRIRKNLIENGEVTVNTFWDALRYVGPEFTKYGESLKIIHFLKHELRFSIKEFFDFIKSNNWHLTKELVELKAMWIKQEEEKQKKKKKL